MGGTTREFPNLPGYTAVPQVTSGIVLQKVPTVQGAHRVMCWSLQPVGRIPFEKAGNYQPAQGQYQQQSNFGAELRSHAGLLS